MCLTRYLRVVGCLAVTKEQAMKPHVKIVLWIAYLLACAATAIEVDILSGFAISRAVGL